MKHITRGKNLKRSNKVLKHHSKNTATIFGECLQLTDKCIQKFNAIPFVPGSKRRFVKQIS